jgi:excinuclease ABC subunit A
VACRGLELHQPLAGVRILDQRLPPAAGGSSVATLAGVAESLRKRFAATARAKELGLTARHFSTAHPGGRCEACAGRGVITVALDLLPDVTVGCDECHGLRFRPEVLECRVDGFSLAEALDATVAEAAGRFSRAPALAQPLQALAGVGLGYLRLGQEAAALSAGERQRLHLAGLLGSTAASPGPGDPAEGAPRLAILLDEPTRGLGAGEVERLREVLAGLARAGHLVVAVEHDLAFIAGADWIIDLGPEGGAGGGRVVVQGSPRAVAAGAGHTARALAAFMSGGA